MNSVAFSVWLEELRALPASSPQWEEAREFITAATDIIEAKQTESVQATELTTLLNSIREQFSDELGYLGRSIDSAGADFTSLDDALNVVRELESLFFSYRSVRTQQPKSFDEEERLSTERSEAGERVRITIQGLNEFLVPSEPEPAETVQGETARTLESHEVGNHEQENARTPDELTNSVSESGIGQEADHLESSECSPPEEGGIQEDSVDDIGGLVPSQDKEESVDSEFDVGPVANKQIVNITDQEVVERPVSEAVTDLTEDGDDEDQDIPSVQLDTPRYGIELSTESSGRFLASSSLHDLEMLLWSLVAADDISAAYWIATYLFEEGYESSATPLLLKAVQGARWLSSDVDRFVTDLFDIVSNYSRTKMSAAQELLEFAASIHPTAVASHSPMLDWLRTPKCCPALEPIVRLVSELPAKSVSLRPEYVRGLGKSVTHNEAILSASEDVLKWLEEAPMKFTRYGRANNVWKHFTSEDGQLSAMLAPVGDDARSEVSKVRDGLSKWNPDSVLEIINQTDRELETGRVPKPSITGDARNWLLRGIEDAKLKADLWCRLVEEDKDIRAKTSNNYLIEQVAKLRSEVYSSSQPAMEALSELSSDLHLSETVASALCAQRSLQRLLDTLDIESDRVRPVSPVAAGLALVIGKAENLDLAVARRLLWTDSVKLNDDGLPFRDSLNTVIRDLADSVHNECTLVQAIESRIDLQDYRFLDIMTNGVPNEMKESIKTRRQKTMQDSISTLDGYFKLVERRVRQAARDGVIEIDDVNWIKYNKQLEDISSREDFLNFPALTDRLESIETGLQELSERRYAELLQEWEVVISDQPDADANTICSWKEKFDSAKDRGDLRVMEECLMRLRIGSLGSPYLDITSLDNTEDGAQNSLMTFISFSEEVQDIEGHTRSSTGLSALQSRLSSLG